MRLNQLAVSVVVLLLGACVPLTAERPLFDPLDQSGPAPRL
jgi:hypothetical protein